MEWIADPGIWLSLLTLTILEIVLGIDNLVFLAILAGRLPAERQAAARQLGLALALGTRLVLLFAITWVMGLTAPLFTVLDMTISWRDIILIAGGLFLIAKGTFEIDHKLEGADEGDALTSGRPASFAGVVLQIGIMDLVFSIDSVVTAVGMAQHIEVMVAAIVISMAVMLVAAAPVSDFVNRHPTVKMLALSFLLLIGTALVADGLGFHIPKGYIYFAMGFAIFVETLNVVARARRQRRQAARRAD
jgi:predicted tellurium resistance membrane protein TerC